MGPDIHNLVVALTISQQARLVLFLNGFHFSFRFTEDVDLFIRGHHIIDTNGDAGTSGIGKTGIHQLVSKDNRILQSDTAITIVDEFGYSFFLKITIDF